MTDCRGLRARLSHPHGLIHAPHQRHRYRDMGARRRDIAMTTAKIAHHTPGPWRVKGTEIWAAHKRITMGRGAYDEKDRAIRDANAAFIVRAALQAYSD